MSLPQAHDYIHLTRSYHLAPKFANSISISKLPMFMHDFFMQHPHTHTKIVFIKKRFKMKSLSIYWNFTQPLNLFHHILNADPEQRDWIKCCKNPLKKQLFKSRFALIHEVRQGLIHCQELGTSRSTPTRSAICARATSSAWTGRSTALMSRTLSGRHMALPSALTIMPRAMYFFALPTRKSMIP